MPSTFAFHKSLFCIFMFVCILAGVAQSQENAVRPQGIYSSNFVIDGIPRTINFYIPLHYGTKDNYPVVFFFHAEGESGKSVIKKYGEIIQRLADESSCIVVYPDAAKGHWSSKIGEHSASDSINDAGFIAIMTGYFIQQYHGDLARIYTAGFYNGGEMAWRLSCTPSNKITAAAPFITSVQAAAKACTAGVYFEAEKFMPMPGKRFTNESIEAAWKFLMSKKKP